MTTCVKLVNGVAVSHSYTPKAVGSYEFQASYSGDCNYYPSASMKCTELLCVSKACPVATTAIGASEIILGQSVTDNVTVTGLGACFPVPTGKVVFQVSFNNGPWMNIGDAVVLHNGQATSCFYQPTAEGSYSFQAIYRGDCNYCCATSAAGSEILTVDNVPLLAADPSVSCIATDLGTTQIVLGSSVMDNATITAADGAHICGTVDFSVSYNWGPFVVYDRCEKVVNGMASSTFFTPEQTGNYRFIACYSGNHNVLPCVSGENCEKLIVCQAASSTATCLSQTSIQCGATVYDTAYVTGIAGFVLPSGTVTFSVSCDNGNTWKQIGAPVKLVNGQATSAVYNPCIAGTYEFQASYSGDCNYLASADCPCSEILTVSGEFWSITLGQSVTDNATVTGLAGFPGPTGFVNFQYSYEHGCWTTYTCNVPLVNGQAISGWFTPLATGHYNFRAVYTGDNNYNPSVSGSCEEPMFVCPAPSSTSTLLSSSDIVLGHCVTDTATVQGLCGNFPCPTGTVTFQYSYEGCAWKDYSVGVDLVNCQATSAAFVPLAAGCYEFRAIYSGDCNYLASISLPHTEQLTVERAPSTSYTSLGTDTIVLGQSVRDNVTVLGVGPCFPTPTGPVSFQVSYNGGEWVEYSQAMLNCNGQAIGGFYMPLVAGNYEFRVVYTCDSNYLECCSVEGTEPLLVDPAPSHTATLLSQSDIVLGNSVYDQVAVCGLGGDFPVPTGTVDFQVSNNGGCSWYVFESCVALVDGKATSVCYTPHAAATICSRPCTAGTPTTTRHRACSAVSRFASRGHHRTPPPAWEPQT